MIPIKTRGTSMPKNWPDGFSAAPGAAAFGASAAKTIKRSTRSPMQQLPPHSAGHEIRPAFVSSGAQHYTKPSLAPLILDGRLPTSKLKGPELQTAVRPARCPQVGHQLL